MIPLSASDPSDREFIEQLYTRHHGLIYWKIHQVLDKTQDMDDIVSEVCIRLTAHVSTLRSLEEPAQKAYILSAARNTALMHVRKASYQQETAGLDELNPFLEGPSPAADDRMLRECDVEDAMQCIGMLPERDQVLLKMKYLSHMSDEEIGRALGMRPNAVRTAATRARQRARTLLKELMDRYEN